MAIAKRDEGKKVNSDINVTPMVDVMLVLLIIFMVVLPFLQRTYYVEMAKTEHPAAMPDADKEDSVVVAVTRDGRIYLGGESIGLDQLGARINDKLQRKTERRVFVKADAHAKYGVVVTVVDNLRSANVDNLGLLTEQSKRVLPSRSGDEKKTELKT